MKVRLKNQRCCCFAIILINSSFCFFIFPADNDKEHDEDEGESNVVLILSLFLYCCFCFLFFFPADSDVCNLGTIRRTTLADLLRESPPVVQIIDDDEDLGDVAADEQMQRAESEEGAGNLSDSAKHKRAQRQVDNNPEEDYDEADILRLMEKRSASPDNDNKEKPDFEDEDTIIRTEEAATAGLTSFDVRALSAISERERAAVLKLAPDLPPTRSTKPREGGSVLKRVINSVVWRTPADIVLRAKCVLQVCHGV